MTAQERIDRMEDVMVVINKLLVRHAERIDTFDADFKRSREDFEFRMNAVIDAQLNNESEIEKLKESTTELEASTTNLEASISKLEVSTIRLEASVDKLKESTNDLKNASRSQLNRIERLEQI